MNKQAQRPITRRIITCVKQSSWVKLDDKVSYAGVTSQELIDKLHISPRQCYQAVSSLCKSGKLTRIARGLYNIPLTNEQRNTLAAFIDDCRTELDTHATVNDIEQSLLTIDDVQQFLRGQRK